MHFTVSTNISNYSNCKLVLTPPNIETFQFWSLCCGFGLWNSVVGYVRWKQNVPLQSKKFYSSYKRVSVLITLFCKITEIMREAKPWERESYASYFGAVCSVMVQRSASTSVWGTTMLPLYSDGMVVMLTQSNDELIIKNGLPKCRQRMVKNLYAAREHGKLVRIIVML